MDKIRKRVLLVAVIVFLQGCAAVTITPKGQSRLETPPTYTQKQPLYMFGLVGEPHVDVKEICGDKEVRQLQTIDLFTDRLLGIVTLGIYSPRTANVWCEEGVSS